MKDADNAIAFSTAGFALQESPVIWSFTPSNSTPWPGDTITLQFNITDNSGSSGLTTSFDLSPMTYAGGDMWNFTYNIPTLDGVYIHDVFAIDASGNNATKNLYVKV